MSTRVQELLKRGFGNLRHEPTERRIRADDALDSTRALLVWEPRRVVPSYAVPEDDITASVAPSSAPVPDQQVPGVLHPGIPFAVHTAAGSAVDVGGRTGAGFRLDEIPGYVVLDFAAFDRWYEEDEPVLGHPRDPFSRVDVRRTSRPVRIEIDGQVVAETTHARLLFETGLPTRFYLPRSDVRGELVPSARRSYCPYKGEASYWSLGDHVDVAWSYEHPLADGPLIDGLVAFWDEKVEVYLDGQRQGAPAGEGADALREAFAV